MSGRHSIQVEVAVVGGGPVACFLATDLASQGIRVALVEAASSSTPSFAASPGLAMPGIGEAPSRLARAIGLQDMLELYTFSLSGLSLLTSTLAQLQCAFWREPAVQAAWLPWELTELQESIEQVASLSAAPTWRGSETLPAGLLGGLEWPGCVRYRLPELAEALERAADRVGVQRCAGPVLALDDRTSGVTVCTPSLAVEAAVAVVCPGSEPPPPLDFLTPLLFRARIQRCETSPLPEVRLPSGTASSGLDCWYQEPSGSLVLSGFRYLSPELGLRYDAPGLDARIQRHMGQLVERWSHGTAAVVQEWSAFVDTTCDGLPLVGPVPGRPQVMLLAGFHGLDASLGLLCAACLGDALLERVEDRHIPAWFNPRRML